MPNDIDAAITWKGRNYFFKGCTAYAYGGKGLKKIVWTDDIPTIWKVPCNLDAAASWGDHIYLFKGPNVYRWSYQEDSFIKGPLQGHSQFPGDLDAGFHWKYNKITYLLKNEKYWRIYKNGNTLKRKTKIGFKGLFDSTLLPNCGCSCMDGVERENWEFESIQYHIEKNKTHLLPPTEVGKKIIDNLGGGQNPSTEFTVSISVTETQSFTHATGLSLTLGTEFNCGIPTLTGSTISVDGSVSYNFLYGKERSSTTIKEAKFICPAAAAKITTCIATLRMQQIDVPYTMTLHHNKKECKCIAEGIFHGKSATHMSMIVTESN